VLVRLPPLFLAVSSWLVAWLVLLVATEFSDVTGGSQGYAVPSDLSATGHDELALASVRRSLREPCRTAGRGAPGGRLGVQRRRHPAPRDQRDRRLRVHLAAPLLEVVETADSQSQPGQRNTGIVWQGFSSGRRLLGARASLEPLAAERGLPLAVEFERRGDTTVLRLVDIPRRRVEVTGGSAPARTLIPVVTGLRGAFARGDRNALARTLQVEGSPRGAESIVVDAPLRVRGMVSAEGRAPMPIDVVLGKDRPLVRTISVPGPRPPKVSLRAELFRPEELLPTRRELSAARDPLRLIQVALARVALSGQYDQYLASPDQLGPNRTTYLMRTVAERASVPTKPRPSTGGDGDVLAVVLASVLGAAALVGLAVAWAHS
jgi:hypothetical protein